MTGDPQDQYMVRSKWPTGDMTEALYSVRRSAEIELWFRCRYSRCEVWLLRRRVTPWVSMDGEVETRCH